MHSEKTVRCHCSHHIIIPVFIALIGIAFLLNNLNLLPVSAFNIIWPSLVALTGLQMIFARRCKCHEEHGHCNHCHHCPHDGTGQN